MELRTIFDLIVKISILSEGFHKLALAECETRQKFIKENAVIESDDKIDEVSINEKKRFQNEVKPKIKQTKHQTQLLKQSFEVSLSFFFQLFNVSQSYIFCFIKKGYGEKAIRYAQESSQ